AGGGRPAGLTLAMQDLQAVDGGEARRDEERRLSEDVFLEAARGDDFMGVQTYTRLRYGPDGMRGPEPGVPTTQMGYEFWPDALEATIRRAWAMTEHVPLFVTENGIATSEDAERIAYVDLALRGVLACLAEGTDGRGYISWSLLDTFEWVFGSRPPLGPIAVARATQQRTVKPSAGWLGSRARANRLELPTT